MILGTNSAVPTTFLVGVVRPWEAERIGGTNGGTNEAIALRNLDFIRVVEVLSVDPSPPYLKPQPESLPAGAFSWLPDNFSKALCCTRRP